MEAVPEGYPPSAVPLLTIIPDLSKKTYKIRGGNRRVSGIDRDVQGDTERERERDRERERERE